MVLDEAYFPISLNCKNVNTIMRLTYKKWDSDKYFGYIKEFGLPETLIPVNILAVGHPAGELKSPDRHATERIPTSELVIHA